MSCIVWNCRIYAYCIVLSQLDVLSELSDLCVLYCIAWNCRIYVYRIVLFEWPHLCALYCNVASMRIVWIVALSYIVLFELAHLCVLYCIVRIVVLMCIVLFCCELSHWCVVYCIVWIMRIVLCCIVWNWRMRILLYCLNCHFYAQATPHNQHHNKHRRPQ